MAAKQKHRTAGNSYNLRQKVEIPIELQLNNDNTFLNEFASQPEPGQSSKSRSDTDTDSNTSIDLEIGTLLSQESVDFVDESPVHVQTKKYKNQTDLHVLKIQKVGRLRLEVNRIRHSLMKGYFLNWTQLVSV